MDNPLNNLKNDLKDYLRSSFLHDPNYPIEGTLKAIDVFFKSAYIRDKLKSVKPSAPAIALFCSIINQSGIDKKGDESNEKYCMRICKKFDLTYKDRVRQEFATVLNIDIAKAKHLPEVQKSIFPFLDNNKQNRRIIEFLNTKIKMYA